MAFAGMNLFAIAVAAVAGYLFGGLWFNAAAQFQEKGTVFARNALTPAHVRKVPFVLAFAGELLMAAILAGLLGHLGPGQVTMRNGLISAGIVWAGFVLVPIVIQHSFRNESKSRTLVESGHWLGVLLVQGAILGAFGVE